MATRKMTVTIDETTAVLAERSARREGLSVSAWLSRAARREAVRTGFGPMSVDANAVDKALADAQADEAEFGEAEREMRAAG
jgi:hypothetical protein